MFRRKRSTWIWRYTWLYQMFSLHGSLCHGYYIIFVRYAFESYFPCILFSRSFFTSRWVSIPLNYGKDFLSYYFALNKKLSALCFDQYSQISQISSYKMPTDMAIDIAKLVNIINQSWLYTIKCVAASSRLAKTSVVYKWSIW